ncbi:SDR family oxidoreductase [Azospirillum sp. sgz301742]
MARWLIFGATGLLGQALMREARRRGLAVAGAARSAADIACDVTDPEAVAAAFDAAAPDFVVNAAALVDLDRCESDPRLAYMVNARAAAFLAEQCRQRGSRLVHISTDHYWRGEGARLHGEAAPVRLLNEYARSKYAGEAFAATAPGALVVRTNITGFRGWAGRPTFAEWCLDVIERDAPVTLFDDFHTSTIDAPSCAAALFDLVALGAGGLLNVAAREAASKAAFVDALAAAANRRLSRATHGSVAGLATPRADSLGLDVTRAEAILGRRLPDTAAVVRALCQQYGEGPCVTTAS